MYDFVHLFTCVVCLIFDAGRQKNITETAALTEAEALISSSDAPFFKKIMKAAELKPGGYLVSPAPARA